MSDLSWRVLVRQEVFPMSKLGDVIRDLAKEVEALEGLLEANLADTRIMHNDMQTRIDGLEEKVEFMRTVADTAVNALLNINKLVLNADADIKPKLAEYLEKYK